MTNDDAANALAWREYILKQYGPILMAADMWDERYHYEDAYVIAGSIIHDQELFLTRRAMWEQRPPNPAAPCQLPTCAEALATWTPEQKAALKQRLLKRHGSREPQ